MRLYWLEHSKSCRNQPSFAIRLGENSPHVLLICQTSSTSCKLRTDAFPPVLSSAPFSACPGSRCAISLESKPCRRLPRSSCIQQSDHTYPPAWNGTSSRVHLMCLRERFPDQWQRSSYNGFQSVLGPVHEPAMSVLTKRTLASLEIFSDQSLLRCVYSGTDMREPRS